MIRFGLYHSSFLFVILVFYIIFNQSMLIHYNLKKINYYYYCYYYYYNFRYIRMNYLYVMYQSINGDILNLNIE